MTATAAAPRAATPTLDPNTPPPAGQNNPAAERLFEKIQQGNPRHRAMPADMDEKWRLAETLLASGLCPKVGRKSDRRDMTVQEVFVMLQLGDELGLAPMQAVQGIAVVEGRPAPMYQTMLAVCRSSGKLESYAEDITEERAVVTVKRLGDSAPLSATFSLKDAVRAQLLGNPTWQKYPRDMLRNRAGGRALKIAFADVLAGIALEDEIEDALADRADEKASRWKLTREMVAKLNADVAQRKIPADEWKRMKLQAAAGAKIEVSSDGVPTYTREQWERLEASVQTFAGATPARGAAPQAQAEPETETAAATPAPAPATPPKLVAERARSIGRKYGLDEAALLATVRSSTPHTSLDQLTEGDLEMLDEVLAARDEAQEGGDR